MDVIADLMMLGAAQVDGAAPANADPLLRTAYSWAQFFKDMGPYAGICVLLYACKVLWTNNVQTTNKLFDSVRGLTRALNDARPKKGEEEE